jgi:hypothetical protein
MLCLAPVGGTHSHVSCLDPLGAHSGGIIRRILRGCECSPYVPARMVVELHEAIGRIVGNDVDERAFKPG